MSADGRTVIRTGGGLYYESSMSIATDVLNGGPLSISNLTSSIHSPASSSLSYGFLPNLRMPKVWQWNVSAEQAFGAHSVVSLGYVGSAAAQIDPEGSRRRRQHIHLDRRSHYQPRPIRLPRFAGAIPSEDVA